MQAHGWPCVCNAVSQCLRPAEAARQHNNDATPAWAGPARSRVEPCKTRQDKKRYEGSLTWSPLLRWACPAAGSWPAAAPAAAGSTAWRWPAGAQRTCTAGSTLCTALSAHSTRAKAQIRDCVARYAPVMQACFCPCRAPAAEHEARQGLRHQSVAAQRCTHDAVFERLPVRCAGPCLLGRALLPGHHRRAGSDTHAEKGPPTPYPYHSPEVRAPEDLRPPQTLEHTVMVVQHRGF